jgi:hypothetical protein
VENDQYCAEGTKNLDRATMENGSMGLIRRANKRVLCRLISARVASAGTSDFAECGQYGQLG